MIRFHGGCSDCTQQEKNGVDFCYDCRNFDGQWHKPDLNNSQALNDVTRSEVIVRVENARRPVPIIERIFNFFTGK